MGKIEQKKELKRANILKAALHVFLSEGYIGAGMDRIAEQAGVTKQTVYRYFESKENLFRNALEALRESNPNHFLNELDNPDTRKALTRFAQGFLGVHLSETHLAGIRLLVAEGPEAPEMTRAFFAVGQKQTTETLARFLRERLGADDPDYSVKFFLGALLSLRMSVLVGLFPPPSAEVIAKHADRTVRQFLRMFPEVR
ncbi:TetR/AcrR family transcriptional regulator [Pseudodesulfovibrio sp.]|uniref:TetR/AcrR family transcriptional regulator n=1 Tax=unclassified Pseudodesulfovibrio TaxID=2661612 RepID=UPI003B00D912